MFWEVWEFCSLLSNFSIFSFLLTFFLQKESNKEKLFSFQILSLFEARCSLQRLRFAPAYMRRLKRLCRTPHRFSRRRCLAITCLRSLRIRSWTAPVFAALTALYLLRESFKLLIFLKFLKLLIICHALPFAYGFAVIPNGMDIPGFLFAVALAHPVVYSHFRILQSKKRKLYEKVWKKMRGCRGRRKEPFLKRFFLLLLQLPIMHIKFFFYKFTSWFSISQMFWFFLIIF